jgi:hypothetical protein
MKKTIPGKPPGLFVLLIKKLFRVSNKKQEEFPVKYYLKNKRYIKTNQIKLD